MTLTLKANRSWRIVRTSESVRGSKYLAKRIQPSAFAMAAVKSREADVKLS